jgi:hypothetical protein
VIWIAAAYGPVAAVLAAAVVLGVAGVLATAVQIRMLQGRFLEFAAALAPGYSGIAAMAAVLIGMRLAVPIDSAVTALGVHVAVGAVTYVGWLLAFHRKPVLEAWAFLSHTRMGAVNADRAAAAPAQSTS